MFKKTIIFVVLIAVTSLTSVASIAACAQYTVDERIACDTHRALGLKSIDDLKSAKEQINTKDIKEATSARLEGNELILS
jgi:hypothetical protein